MKHEDVCPDRTITCPAPNGCDEKVQLKHYHQHAVDTGCSVEMKDSSTKFNLSKGWMKWDGVSRKKG